MSLTSWTAELCEALGLDLDLESDAILDLARDAAHQIDRPAAPLTTFLVGYAAGMRGGSSDDIADCVDVASELLANQES